MKNYRIFATPTKSTILCSVLSAHLIISVVLLIMLFGMSKTASLDESVSFSGVYSILEALILTCTESGKDLFWCNYGYWVPIFFSFSIAMFGALWFASKGEHTHKALSILIFLYIPFVFVYLIFVRDGWSVMLAIILLFHFRYMFYLYINRSRSRIKTD